MAVYDKDKSFSFGWTLGGAIIMGLILLFSHFILLGSGVENLWIYVAVWSGGFAAGGFVIGWQSEGQTIIEAGIAAILVLGAAVGFGELAALSVVKPVAAAMVIGPPFAFSVLGAFLGEKVQGDVIETDDG
jgi:hypothetical protein